MVVSDESSSGDGGRGKRGYGRRINVMMKRVAMQMMVMGAAVEMAARRKV